MKCTVAVLALWTQTLAFSESFSKKHQSHRYIIHKCLPSPSWHLDLELLMTFLTVKLASLLVRSSYLMNHPTPPKNFCLWITVFDADKCIILMSGDATWPVVSNLQPPLYHPEVAGEQLQRTHLLHFYLFCIFSNQYFQPVNILEFVEAVNWLNRLGLCLVSFSLLMASYYEVWGCWRWGSCGFNGSSDQLCCKMKSLGVGVKWSERV